MSSHLLPFLDVKFSKEEVIHKEYAIDAIFVCVFVGEECVVLFNTDAIDLVKCLQIEN
jgi:hypothetical protein